MNNIVFKLRESLKVSFGIIGRFVGVLFIVLLISGPSIAQTDGISVHDPSIIKQGKVYHIFCTGFGITHWYSNDMKRWKRGRPVFKESPNWVKELIPNFRNHIWAPDISYHDGKYYLYYVVSSFGKNTSAIGLATNTTLDESDPAYSWKDYGPVVNSVQGRDMWNAIDPNLIIDQVGTPWLSFGSFWDGIKLVRLKRDLIKMDTPEKWFTIASRERTFGMPDSLAGDAAIEAPFIFYHQGYYYLFVSFDYCCRGINSTYKIMVGRSGKVEGPYIDKDGKEMIAGGGSVVLRGDKHWPGVGHNAILDDNGIDYLVFHAYNALDNGKPMLRILSINWIDGWPVVDEDLL